MLLSLLFNLSLSYAEENDFLFLSYQPKNITLSYSVGLCKAYERPFNIRYTLFINFIYPFSYDDVKVESNIPLNKIMVARWNELENTLVIEANTPNITFFNLTLHFTNFKYEYYPLYDLYYFYPVFGETHYYIVIDNLIKVYYYDGSKSISEYLVCGDPKYYSVVLKSPTKSQSIYYHRRELILALLYLALGITALRYIFPYLYALLNIYKLKRLQKEVLTRIRKIEEDYFHRRISDKMFNELIREEQRRYYNIEAKIIKLKKLMRSWEILNLRLRKKKR